MRAARRRLRVRLDRIPPSLRRSQVRRRLCPASLPARIAPSPEEPSGSLLRNPLEAGEAFGGCGSRVGRPGAQAKGYE